MKAVTKFLAGGVAAAALFGAAPAAAQYYPGYGNPGYGYGNPVGQVINQVPGAGYGGYGYGVNSQAVVGQCTNAVQARLNGGYGGGYGGYGSNGYASPYGYGGGARVLGVSRVEPRSGGGLTVHGVASTGRYGGSNYGYGGQSQVDLVWRCRTDYRGFITGISVDAAERNYGNNYAPYNNYNAYDYSQYGYRRY
jgi:hypothetical protein